MVVGELDVIRETLVDSHKIILSPMHVEFDLMKQFVNALNKEEGCFDYICWKYPVLGKTKGK